MTNNCFEASLFEIDFFKEGGDIISSICANTSCPSLFIFKIILIYFNIPTAMRLVESGFTIFCPSKDVVKYI